MAKARKARKPSGQGNYFGKAGHLTVMSELLLRGWNVAIPEVDAGDDIFVVRDSDGNFLKVQVKSANSKINKGGGHTSKFKLRINQLRNVIAVELVYAFVIRYKDKWSHLFLIGQKELSELYEEGKIGTSKSNEFTLSIKVKGQSIRCINYSMRKFLYDWSKFPVIKH
jgi:hypothetical protein